MSRILVTGGSGFIGTNLAAELRSRDHDVVTCDLTHTADPRSWRVDVANYRELAAVFESQTFDVVYHLAAEYGRWNGEDHYERLWRTNMVGTKNVLRFQQELGFRLVFFSSAEVYGDHDELMAESVMDGIPIRQMNDYAISKWAGELQCLNHADMHGAEIVRVRPVGCYGPHEYYSPYRGVIPIFVYKALRGEQLVVHRGHRRIFDYVEDTCRTFANITDNFKPGEVYNVGGREKWAISIEELAEIVIDATGADESQLVLKDTEPHTTVTKVVDFSKAIRDLDHDPQIDIDVGVARYAAWVKATHEITA